MVALLPSAIVTAYVALAACAHSSSKSSTHKPSKAKINSVASFPNVLPTHIASNLGKYSPYQAQGTYPPLPRQCQLEQVHILERHGARSSTSKNSANLAKAVKAVQKASAFAPELAFAQNYTYGLPDSEDLTALGAYQAWESGVRHYARYAHLAATKGGAPFVRADSAQRTVATAGNWSLGFAYAPQTVAGSIAVILDDSKSSSNDTLDDNNCPNLPDDNPAEDTWQDIYAATPAARINALATGAAVSTKQVTYLMELCGFETEQTGVLSEWCNLFYPGEWDQFNYYNSLDSWYVNSYGSATGTVEGLGYLAELLSRLTGNLKYVNADATTTNKTLDSSPATFPLGRPIYADFGHDPILTSVVTALGLKNGSALAATGPRPGNAFAASAVVPFSGNLVTERVACGGRDYVRLVLNDELQVPANCAGVDGRTGLCLLSEFVKAQEKAIAASAAEFGQCGYATRR